MLIYILSLIGVFVFSVSGALAAGEKKLDWVGVTALAAATALGGGTIRDVLLNREMVFWIKDPIYIWVVLFAVVFTIVSARFLKPSMNILLIADALGLALFSILGSQVAERYSISLTGVVIMGILTGVAGGVIRDVLLGEIPLLFRSTEPLYSVAALGGILFYLLLQYFGLSKDLAAWFGVFTIASLRLSAMFWGIRLPIFRI